MCSQKPTASPLGETKNKGIGGGKDLLDLLRGQRERGGKPRKLSHEACLILVDFLLLALNTM